MHEVMEQRMSRWKSGTVQNPMIIRCPRNFYLRSQNRFDRSDTYKPKVNGVRFSVSRHDPHLLADVLWTEMHLNEDVHRYMRGLARYVDMLIGCWSIRLPRRRDFWSMGRSKEAHRSLSASRLPLYLKVYMVRTFIKNWERRQFAPEVMKVIGWDGDEPWQLSLAASALPGVGDRFAMTRLRIMNGNERHVSVELYPHYTQADLQRAIGNYAVSRGFATA
jgi:hypothetical protein